MAVVSKPQARAASKKNLSLARFISENPGVARIDESKNQFKQRNGLHWNSFFAYRHPRHDVGRWRIGKGGGH